MKLRTIKNVLLCLCLIAAPVVFAAEPQEIPPAISQGLAGEEGIQPEVTIIRKQEGTIEEYRIRGQLYMVKVTPIKGPSYYLLDRDGDGELESRQNELDPSVLVPSWILLRW